MTCQQELRRQGKPYPRTCAECGLGPCKFKGAPPPDPQATRIASLTEAVRVLTEALEHAKSQIQHPDQMIDDALTTAKELTK